MQVDRQILVSKGARNGRRLIQEYGTAFAYATSMLFLCVSWLLLTMPPIKQNVFIAIYRYIWPLINLYVHSISSKPARKVENTPVRLPYVFVWCCFIQFSFRCSNFGCLLLTTMTGCRRVLLCSQALLSAHPDTDTTLHTV